MNYMNMITKAHEIQYIWIPKIGDNVCHRGSKDIFQVKHIFSDKPHHNDLIWVPTVEQLIELLEVNNTEILGQYLSESISEIAETHHMNFKRLEEIILSVIMYNKYNKVWIELLETWTKVDWK